MKRFFSLSLFFIIMFFPISSARTAVVLDIPIVLNSEESINFSGDIPSFQLTFPTFTNGSISNAVTVNYSVQANDVERVQDVVTVKADIVYPGIDVEADFQSFTLLSGDASLTEAQSGFVVVGTQDTGLADKVVETSPGRTVDGNFAIQYRAKATSTLSAGNREVIITVTFTSV